MTNNEFGEAVFKMSRLVWDEMTVTCYAASLTMQQFHAIIFLSQHKDAQMRDIADYFHIEMPIATSLLNKLVTLKLVKRTADKTDRRIVHISLTVKGKDVLQ